MEFSMVIDKVTENLWSFVFTQSSRMKKKDILCEHLNENYY